MDLIVFFLIFNLHSFFCYQVYAYTKTKEPTPAIRVLIGRSLSNIILSGKDIKRTVFHTGNVKSHQGLYSIKFLCPSSIKQMQSFLNSRKMILAQVDTPSGIVSWNDSLYRGDLMVVKNPKEGCHLVHRTNLEDYISSLLAKEMNRNWPIEALKAQAVAARSYALYQMNQKKLTQAKGERQFYDLENSEKNQVSGTMGDESQATIKAAQETKGEVLLDPSGKLGPIFYHAKCGGQTLLPIQVWDKPEVGYAAVKCPYRLGHGNPSWNYIMNKNELKSFNKKYSFKSKIYLRRFLGRDKIKSNNFTIKQVNQEIHIKGEGNGHGVGMCQFGALAMADMGWDYKKILQYYYPRHELSQYY